MYSTYKGSYMKFNRTPYNGMILYNDVRMLGLLKWYQMAKKIIKAGLTKTREKGDCMRSEKEERFIVWGAKVGQGSNKGR